jgi:hypothetical protein
MDGRYLGELAMPQQKKRYQPDAEPILIRVRAVGATLGGLSLPYVYQLIKTGRLEMVRVGTASFVTMASVKALVAAGVTMPGEGGARPQPSRRSKSAA